MKEVISDRLQPGNLFWLNAVTLLIMVVSWGLEYLLQVYVGRHLGAEDYGDYAVAISAATLISYLCGLGAEDTIPRFLQTYQSSGQFTRMVGFLRAHLAAILVFSAVTCAGGMVVVGVVWGDRMDHPLMIIWWLIPPLAVAEFLYIALTNFGRPVLSAGIHQLALPLLTIGGVFLLTILGGNLTDYRAVGVHALAAVFILPLYLVLVLRIFPKETWMLCPAYEWRLWVITALPMLFSILAYYALGQVDLYAMEQAGSEKDVGIMAACMKTADFVYLTFSAAYLILSPHIATLVENGQVEKLRRLVRTAVRSILILSTVVAVVIILMGRTILGWFGEGFTDGYWPMLVLLIVNIPQSALTLAWPLLSLSGHERVPLPGFLIAVPVIYGSSLLIIPHFGIMGAVICKTVTSMLLFGWLAIELHRRVGVGLWEV